MNQAAEFTWLTICPPGPDGTHVAKPKMRAAACAVSRDALKRNRALTTIVPKNASLRVSQLSLRQHAPRVYK